MQRSAERNQLVFLWLGAPCKLIIGGKRGATALRESRMRRLHLQLSDRGRLCIALGLVAFTLPAAAQTYPSGMIRFIVPGAAGTPPDIVVRLITNELSQAEGWRL